MKTSDVASKRAVAIVDDDDLSRAGIEVVLARDDRLDVRTVLTHDQALSDDTWFGVDVVLVDAADERRSGDQFPGVDVVRVVRRHRTADQTTIVVITGHYFDDAVRTRMREARADLFFHRVQLQDAAYLCDVIAEPSQVFGPVPEPQDPETLFRHGVNQSTKVNVAVDFGREQGWLRGDLHQTGRRPRSFDRLREAFARAAQVHAVNTDGTMPDREQIDPSRPQIARLLDWATRAKH